MFTANSSSEVLVTKVAVVWTSYLISI